MQQPKKYVDHNSYKVSNQLNMTKVTKAHWMGHHPLTNQNHEFTVNSFLIVNHGLSLVILLYEPLLMTIPPMINHY